MFATGQMLRDLKSTGTQESWLDRMQTRKELYELLDYDPMSDAKQRLASNVQSSPVN